METIGIGIEQETIWGFVALNFGKCNGSENYVCNVINTIDQTQKECKGFLATIMTISGSLCGNIYKIRKSKIR